MDGMSLQHVIARIRRAVAGAYQRSFPIPFRITPSVAVLWQVPANCAIVVALAPVGKTTDEVHPRTTKNEESLTEAFASALCNEHFRLVSHITQLERTVDSPRLMRRLRNTAEDLQQIFAQQDIEYCDLTGQDYHEGRLDFENIAPAEVDTSLAKPKIALCEHPAVFLKGRLIQTARGIVARPP